MKIFIVLRKLNTSEIESILKEENKTIIYNDHHFVDNKIINDCNVEKKNPSPDCVTKSFSEAFELTQAFGHKQIKNKTIIEWLTINKNTLWYYTRFILFNRYKDTLFKINYINHVINEVSSREQCYYYVFTDESDISEYFDQKNINIIIKQKKAAIKWHFLYYLIISMLRTLLGIIFLPFFSSKRIKHIIIANPVNKQSSYSARCNKKKQADPYLNNLIEKAQYNKNFRLLTEIYHSNTKRLFQKNFFSLLFDRNWRKTIFFEPFIFFTFFLKEYSKLCNALEECYEIIYNDVLSSTKSEQLLLKKFLKLQGLHKFALRRELAATLMLKKYKNLNTISCINEHGMNNKTILNVAANLNIITIGIQHGLIYDSHFEYMYGKEDQKFHPFPDYTIVWGEKWKHLLVKKSCYYENNIIVLGHLRTDLIHHIKNIKTFDNPDFVRFEKPVILYASQPLFKGDENIRYKYGFDFLQLSKDFKNLFFIIKPHPNEKDYKDFFNKIATEINTKNYQFYTGDLYQILAISRVVIIYYSTVGLESIYFNKPVIAFDYHNNDITGLIKEKVAFQATEYNSLKKLITQIREGQKMEILKDKRDNYIRERA